MGAPDTLGPDMYIFLYIFLRLLASRRCTWVDHRINAGRAGREQTGCLWQVSLLCFYHSRGLLGLHLAVWSERPCFTL